MGELTEREKADAEALAIVLGESFGYAGIPRWRAVPVAEQLVVDGWARPVPRNEELSLRDELAATIAGIARPGKQVQPVALAEYLVNDGWLKLESGQHVVSNEDAILLAQLKAAVSRWESLKKKAKKPAEVRGDESHRTSGVKLTTPATRILAVFRSATGPLFASEAIDMANGEHVGNMGPLDTTWHYWRDGFSALVEMQLLEPAYEPVREEMERRYQLTAAGRAWNDGAAS